MRILSYLSPSNHPGFAADSIYVFNRILLSSILQIAPDVDLLVAGPADMPEIHPRVHNIPFLTGVSKFEVRFSFPWDDVKCLLKEAKPDWCFVHMPEQAANFAILIRNHLRLACRLATYIHYLPFMPGLDENDQIEYEANMNENDMGRILGLRIIEGVLASDLTLVPSNFAVQLLRKAAMTLLSNRLSLPRVFVLPPPVDFQEVSEVPSYTQFRMPTFIYNHRLYDEYGTHKVFDLLQNLYRASDREFVIIVTNPTEKRDGERSRLNPTVERNVQYVRDLPFVQVLHFPRRDEYMKTIGHSRAGIGPYKRHALWSMAVMDVLASGRPAICWDVGALREMGIPSKFLARDDEEFCVKFVELLDRKPDSSVEAQCQAVAKLYEATSVARRFIKLIKEGQ